MSIQSLRIDLTVDTYHRNRDTMKCHARVKVHTDACRIPGVQSEYGEETHTGSERMQIFERSGRRKVKYRNGGTPSMLDAHTISRECRIRKD